MGADRCTTGRPTFRRPARTPRFRIRLATGESVWAEAAEIGEGTPHENAMRECDARFEVGIDDLDAARVAPVARGWPRLLADRGRAATRGRGLTPSDLLRRRRPS